MKQKQQPKPMIDIATWDYEDGSVGARVDQMPEGEIWARDEATLQRGIIFLVDHLMEAEKRRKENNARLGMFGGGMQAMWLDGRYTVRWLPVPGFGVSFEVEENLQPWLRVFLDAVMQGNRNATA